MSFNHYTFTNITLAQVPKIGYLENGKYFIEKPKKKHIFYSGDDDLT